MIYEIDTSHVEKYAEKLIKLHRSALPSAIRATLNGAAFHVKDKTLHTSAKENFINRDKNFFKANSTVAVAIGFNINTMASKVGMFENKLKNKSTNYAVKDLEKQEHGGVIGHKTFIPMVNARVGKRGVTRKGLLVDKVVDSSIDARKINKRRFRGRSVSVISEKEKFVVAVNVAGKGGFVRSEYKGMKIIWRVNSLNRNEKGGFKLTPMFHQETGRSVKVDPAHFMKEASEIAARKMPTIFELEAEFQIKKYLK